MRVPNRKKSSSRSLFYRVAAWLHLWLGLVSGIVVVIVCLTGCVWVFNEEITGWLEPETRVAVRQQAVLRPSQLMDIAAREYPGKQPGYALYKQGRAIELNVGGRRGGSTLKLDPYTGRVISKVTRKEGEVSFFRWILNGHRFLWLPYKIGRPIVNYSTLVCAIALLTGLVLWWPKKWNRSAREKSFTIKWGASAKRVNYDLHNVLGFYSLLFLLAICFTGMVWGLEWWSKGLFWVTSGGKPLPAFTELQSDSLQMHRHYTPQQAADVAWNRALAENPAAEGFYFTFPDTSKAKSPVVVIAYPDRGQYFNSRRYVFDQHTGKELKGEDLYAKRFEEADFGEKLRKMNYDIHVGTVLGLPGKFLAFFASLIGATLPVTGFLVWLGKKRKKKPAAKPEGKQAGVAAGAGQRPVSRVGPA